MLKQATTCQTCGQPTATGHCDRCFWKAAGIEHHNGFKAIQAILGDEHNAKRALESCGGMIELQELVGELAKHSDEWDVRNVLADWEMGWLQSY